MRLPRRDPLVTASEIPRAPDSFLRVGRRTHRLSRDMMEEAPEATLAEGPIIAGEQNELVPGDIDDLRGHRNERTPAQSDTEVLTQTGEHAIEIGLGQMRVVTFDTRADRVGKPIAVDDFDPPSRLLKSGANSSLNRCSRKFRGW